VRAFVTGSALRDRRLDCGGIAMSILQRLYDSEINFEVSGFYDAGFDVRFGDHLNGFLVEDKVETWADAETWLREQAVALFPDSKFAQNERRAAQAH
jgi:hypothetical protein